MLGFDPFTDFDSLTRGLLSGQQSGTMRTPRFMPMDLYKIEDQYVLTADLPGVDPGSIDVSVDNGVLTLSAQRSVASDEGVKWLASERFAGTYRRQVTLGDGIDTTAISAKYDNGVLSVVIPVAEKAKARKIMVEQSEQAQASITATPA
ncbi:Hsp20/alpha crystallin family protein [Gordonia phosphorivorans]|uniref:Hsp20/alpha crystallin family protein n=1 Tax=Gordonia phosphorivorans TaxID=1056982 RepID=A0ABV6H5G9_9ACTN